MNYGIAGRRALVAGSSSGIGKACATLLAREGVDLFLVSRDARKLEKAASEIRQSPARVEIFAADLSTAEGVDQAIAAALSVFGGIDILISNGGGPRAGTFDVLQDEDWKSAVELNLMSAVRLSRGVLPGMIDSKWGRIVQISSTSIKQPIEGLMLSNAVRMAVAGFTKTLSNEVGGQGITVNTVAPGFTDTPRLSELAKKSAEREGIEVETLVERWKQETPAGRIGLPEEVAAAVLFLASEGASYVNGIVLPVDGGRTRSSL